MTSWDYRIIPTVSFNFTITLTFLSPSQLKDITEYVTDTDSYNFTLEGVRSCDPFTMCITATNIVGQSPPSCVNKTLPYIPSTNDIEYSLLRMGDSYSLNLIIQVLIFFYLIHTFMCTCCKDVTLSYRKWQCLVHCFTSRSECISASIDFTICQSRFSVNNTDYRIKNEITLQFDHYIKQ